MQRLILQILGPLGLVAAVSLSIAPAYADIFPIRGTLEYSETTPHDSLLKIEGTDGKVYELTLHREINGDVEPVEFLDLVLLPAGANESTRNLLEPSLKYWHGYQEFMLSGNDYVEGPAKSLYGPTRSFMLKKQHMMVKATVSQVDVRPIKTLSPNSYAFNRIVVDVEVSNLK